LLSAGRVLTVVLGSIVTDVTIYTTPGCTCHPKETP
jgi:hypothetical protein